MSAAAEMAAGHEPGGPQGPQTPSVEWLILQRLEDLRRTQDDLRTDVKEQITDLRTDVKEQVGEVKEQVANLRADIKALDAKVERQYATLDGKIDRLRTDQRWFIGVLCVAIIGLLAKLFLPAA